MLTQCWQALSGFTHDFGHVSIVSIHHNRILPTSRSGSGGIGRRIARVREQAPHVSYRLLFFPTAFLTIAKTAARISGGRSPHAATISARSEGVSAAV